MNRKIHRERERGNDGRSRTKRHRIVAVNVGETDFGGVFDSAIGLPPCLKRAHFFSLIKINQSIGERSDLIAFSLSRTLQRENLILREGVCGGIDQHS